MIPVLFLLLLCTQVGVYKTPMRNFEMPILDATAFKIRERVDEYRRGRELPPNLRGFKLRWTQTIKRDEEKGSISIYTPWYFKKEMGYFVLSLLMVLLIYLSLIGISWTPWMLPGVIGTAWTDANTSANPTATDMDGGGTDLVDTETVNLATKSIIINKSVTPGAFTVTAGTCTVQNTFTLTLGGAFSAYTCTIDAGGVLTTSGSNYGFTTTSACTVSGTLTLNGSTVSCTGTGTAGTTSIQFVGGTLNGGSATCTFGSLQATSGTNVLILSSGTTTFNAIRGADSAVWVLTSTTTITHSNGTVAFTRAGAQRLYADTTTNRTLYNVIINNASAALAYYAGGSFALTVANLFTITAGSFTSWDGTTSANLTVQGGANIAGTLDCKAATCSFTGTGSTNGYSCEINGGAGAIFTGGSGNHTMGSFLGWGTTPSVTFSSGTTTINNISSDAGNSFTLTSGTTWDDGNGTIAFTLAGAQKMYDNGNTARIFYNLTVNNASAALLYASGKSFALTVANNLTINAGSFTTWDGTTSANLTVTGTTTISAGTLDCKNSTCSFGSGSTSAYVLTTDNAASVFIGGTGAHTIGTIYTQATFTTGSFTATTGVTTVNGGGGAGAGFSALVHNTFTNVSYPGTVTFTYAGNQQLYAGVAGAAWTFTAIIVNNASSAVRGANGKGPTVTTGNLTITLGTYNTSDIVGGTSRDLTVTGTTSITGTLTPNTSTCTFNGTVTVNNGGVLGGNTAWVSTYASTFTGATGSTFTPGTGTHTFNGISSFANTLAIGAAGSVTFNANQTSTAGFTCAATGSLTVPVHVQSTWGANSTSSGTITVNGQLNMAGFDLNSAGAKNGSLGGKGSIYGLMATTSTIYFDTLASGADITTVYATLTYTTDGGGVTYRRYRPGIDAYRVLDIDRILDKPPIDASRRLETVS